MIFAAGKGTRLRPFTDAHPKALAAVNGVPLLERNIRYLQRFGVEDFVINVHHFADQISSFLAARDNFGSRIQLSHEKGELLETGGGLLFAKELLQGEENFLVMNADILTDLDLNGLLEFHRNSDALATLAVSDRKSSRKLLFSNRMLLRGWRNVATGEERLAEASEQLTALAFSGIHCIRATFFDKVKRRGKFSIMEEYLDLMQAETILGYRHSANLIDVGKPESVSVAEKIFK